MIVAGMNKRKYDQSYAAIILRIRQYFEQELRVRKRHMLTHIRDRTAAATRVSRAMISRIKTEGDVQNWPFESGGHVQVSLESLMPKSFAIIVRKAIRHLFLEKKVLPSVNQIYEKILSVEVHHLLNLNLFVGFDILKDES